MAETTDPVAITRRPRRRLVLIGLAGVVVLALVGGLIAWVLWPKHDDRRPFDEALTSLAAAQAINYKTSLAGLAVDLRVTGHGESIGTMSLVGQSFGLLHVAGKSYVKAPSGFLSSAISGSSAAAADRWVAGGAGLVSPDSQLFVSPSQLSQRLRRVLDAATRYGDAPSAVDGIPAMFAHAPVGDLFVSRAKPYRVLRYAPAVSTPFLPPVPTLPSLPGMPSLPGLPGLPGLPSFPDLGGVLTGIVARHLDPTPAAVEPPPATIDVAPLSPAQVNQAYTDLETNNQQLGAAVDPTVEFTGQANATVHCAGECSVTARVTDELTGTGSITAEMTTTINVDGVAAGGCASLPTPMKPNGATTLACDDPESGAYAAAVLAEKKDELGPRGGTVSVTITGEVEVQAMATVQAAVEQQRDVLEQERVQALGSRAPPTTPPMGVRIGPVNLGMRQSGTTEPVKVGGLETPWRVPQDRLTIEAVLGGNMPKNNRVIDTYVADDGGTAISVKTIDWRADAYRLEPSGIYSKGLQALTELANYRSGIDLWNPLIKPANVKVWVLQMAYPAGAPARYLAEYQKIVDEGKEKDITVQLIPIIE